MLRRMHWSLRTKILAGYLLAIVLLVAIGATALANLKNLLENARWKDHTRAVINNIDDSLLLLVEAEAGQRGFVLTGQESFLGPFVGVQDLLDKNLNSLRELTADNPRQQERLSRLAPLVAERVLVLGEVVEIRRKEGLEAAQGAILTGKGRAIMQTIEKIDQEMREEETKLLEARAKATESAAQRFSLSIFIGVPLGALALLLVGRAIAVGIARPVGMLTHAAEKIAAGDLAVVLPDEERGDEVGQLAKSFRRMSSTLSEVVAVNERIAQGDLTSVVQPQSDADKFGRTHQEMILQLSKLVGAVQRAGLQVNTSATEIAATARQQQATATEVAATTTQIGATSREIAATSKELVRTVGEVGHVAQETAELAGSGQTGLARMETTMRTIMDASSSISGKLAVLSEKAANINTVVTTITKVADQTNLLSLNAAIEAEKAGEYGLGFAVVATEIRRLADQTAVATYDIEQMVKEMQSAVSAGVMGMDKFSEEVRRGVEEVRQVGDQLARIIQQVQALTPRFEAVNEGMQSQSLGAQQITDALAQLSEAAQQTAESLRNSGVAIDHLNDSARALQGGVARFKLREQA